jgi:predicted N-formylglutamate amidohydrolase
MPEAALLLSCEHGGNTIPAQYQHLFQGSERLLASHRGYDPGALDLARVIARLTRAPLFAATTSRLLIELNRSLDNPDLFSPFVESLTDADRQSLIRTIHQPHWRRVERAVNQGIRRSRIAVHVGVHTFTPVRNGVVRQTDVGLLYDPSRPFERTFCNFWARTLAASAPELRIRRNYPYHGRSDGLTTSLRSRLSPDLYLGIELEVNQKLPRRGGKGWNRLKSALGRSLAEAVNLFSALD